MEAAGVFDSPIRVIMSNERLHAALRAEFPNNSKRRRMIKALKKGKIQKEMANQMYDTWRQANGK